MNIDWAAVDWPTLALLSAFAAVASLIGNGLSFGHRLLGAILTAIFFAALYIAWYHWLHGFALPEIKPAPQPS
jgi:uncharacterized membrane protein YfcA